MREDVPLLEVADLECWRGDRRLFRGLSFAIDSGEAAQITGPNGSGKTTLMRALCGLTRPQAGELRWRGEAVEQSSSAFRAGILYLGHENGLKSELSAMENLRALTDIAGRPRAVSPEQGLARLDLLDYADQPVRTLSSGQRRRVALARMALVDASLWLLDEPFTALDERGVELVNGLFDEHLTGGGALLFTSHSPVALTSGAPTKIGLNQ
ncbi:MAG: cytochrome c biogenesis heme-transporting ATPase CcmA [Gammaproteobacteria bacterium]|nr:cytochrome c biogenesis heme-transporting ATPase CcmA [Gammaproteobacteria bacterium]